MATNATNAPMSGSRKVNTLLNLDSALNVKLSSGMIENPYSLLGISPSSCFNAIIISNPTKYFSDFISLINAFSN